MQLKKLERKIDRTVVSLPAAVYFPQFLDKTTLSYTAVMEIRTDTHLKGQNYSDLSMLFYTDAWLFTRSDSLCVLNTSRKRTDTKSSIGFLAQHISHLGLRLGVNIMIWGFVLGCHAACTTLAGLVVCRTLLEVFESYVAPTLVLIIAMWHKMEQRVS
jgi:MFS transporter, ACS family, allantoate permease